MPTIKIEVGAVKVELVDLPEGEFRSAATAVFNLLERSLVQLSDDGNRPEVLAFLSGVRE